MTLLLTKSFTEGIVPQDDADRWALMHERNLRELAWRRISRPAMPLPDEVTLINEIEAHDAGDVCHVCGHLVTWTDHLPPLTADGPIRCFVDVVAATGIRADIMALKPGERRVDGVVVYSAEFLSGPEVVS